MQTQDQHDQLDQLLRQGRGGSWWPFLLAAALLVGVAGYGISIYDSLPDRIPLHFGATGRRPGGAGSPPAPSSCR